MNRRVAVTGTTGFIGWHVCERLRDSGWTVVAIVRPGSQKPTPAGTERVEARLDASSLGRAFEDADVVVHVAGITRARSADEYRIVNVEGTRAVAEACSGRRLVHISSLTAGGPASAERPRCETDPPSPVTDYGRSKLEGETIVGESAYPRWTILRPAAVYGPRDRQFLPLFQLARRGVLLRLPNAASFALNLVHVREVARAVELALGSESSVRQTLSIADPKPVTMDDILAALAATFGRACRPLSVPMVLLRAGAALGIAGLTRERVAELTSPGFVCDVGRAQECLGFRAAITVAEGFRATAEWYRTNEWL